MHEADRQILYDIGDEVWFSVRGKARLRGWVEKLNPARAKVRCGAEIWAVPYGELHHICGSTPEKRERRMARLKEVAARARELMDSHGLADWSFGFNGARNNLGVCRYREKLIHLNRRHAVDGPPDRVTDTILHEIAHALAGPGAGHGPAWKALARRLGATPKSCAPESEQTRGERDAAKAKFRKGDPVHFERKGEIYTGKIEKMNPKRARVRCLSGVWLVPWAKLELRKQDFAQGGQTTLPLRLRGALDRLQSGKA